MPMGRARCSRRSARDAGLCARRSGACRRLRSDRCGKVRSMRPTTVVIGETEVPRIGLGTNRLQDTAAHAAFVRDAIAAGIRHIDTAHLYSSGDSEAAIGAALASGRPDGVLVATKGGYHDGRPETIAREIEESLRRL